jgi:hypothetical protein
LVKKEKESRKEKIEKEELERKIEEGRLKWEQLEEENSKTIKGRTSRTC